MKNKLIASAFLLCGAQAIASGYYEACNQVLVNGVLEKYEVNRNFEDSIVLKKWLCSEDSGSNGGGGNLGLNVIDVLDFNAGGQSAKQWKRTNCRNTDYDYKGSKSSHILIQRASPEVVSAWAQCIKDIRPDNLVCYAKETDQSLHVVMDLQYGIGNIKNLDIVGTNLTLLNREPTELRPGETSMRYRKVDESRESFFDLNGEADYINVSCNYTVPPKPKNEGKSCEAFRLTTLSNGKISARTYEYLRAEDQVPLFSSRDGSLIGYYPCSVF
ncbi:hypothetical protein [Pseudobacteriovorax antillogorgiicola]|uniref:Uncharacterized protein n=1 Tax=Pseudobacteriovorax antillogorgiicola TaxID=1513793 RepID=A0A1Y6CJP2_9BACT|nr:hypothetical protein [Pseudobacteriovorax antillogorgiicola]TCS46432.1 hypothetical protein EDD56_12496 [Pseudobacteriovorax antillogorgiicola]SMF69058.1 hypothetical protein SAMN06296036_12496 [Pseudobacteriovorax antillogorgiicola]